MPEVKFTRGPDDPVDEYSAPCGCKMTVGPEIEDTDGMCELTYELCDEHEGKVYSPYARRPS